MLIINRPWYLYTAACSLSQHDNPIPKGQRPDSYEPGPKRSAGPGYGDNECNKRQRRDSFSGYSRRLAIKPRALQGNEPGLQPLPVFFTSVPGPLPRLV
jgi:hypothetical protein